jgi:putative nucleotidyltransferase with HDIG domain
MSWYGVGDDMGILRALTPIDTASPSSGLSHVVRDAARDQGVRARVKAVSRILREPALPRMIAAAHCEQAAHLASSLGIGGDVPRILEQSYERFDGKGNVRGLSGERILLLARVLQVAFVAVLHLAFGGQERALSVLRARRGGELDPGCVDALLPLAHSLLAQVSASSVWDELAGAEPAPREQVTDLSRIARAFAQFVDLKSPFTLAHSVGVAARLEAVLQASGAAAEELELGRIAGLLHDLGRSSVPNGIWDKPGPLNRIELERARDHAQQSERILERAELAPELVSIVGAHHERVDGSGYPRGMPAASLGRLARLLQAADVLQALGEERAHRRAYDREAAARLLEQEAKAGRLDRDAVAELLASAGTPLAPEPAREAPAGLSEREVEVLVLLARGLTNKEIGKRLFISPRTVGHHVAHIYAKSGIKTRASAALFAVEHSLVAAAPSPSGSTSK